MMEGFSFGMGAEAGRALFHSLFGSRPTVRPSVTQTKPMTYTQCIEQHKEDREDICAHLSLA